MLTHCPECQQELSTAASQCPHCGAPVDHGKVAGGGSSSPVARPVSPGGYAQPAGAPPGPPQSHCFRNCLIVGCVVLVLFGIGFFVLVSMFVSNIQKSITTDPALMAADGQSMAPEASIPAGYEGYKGIDINFFGFFKAKGELLKKG